jgi:hypothetical protein
VARFCSLTPRYIGHEYDERVSGAEHLLGAGREPPVLTMALDEFLNTFKLDDASSLLIE